MRTIAVGLCVMMFGCGYHIAKEVGIVEKTIVFSGVETPSKPVIDVRKVVRIWGSDTIGHGCPVSATEAFTASHVAGDFVGTEHDVRRAPPVAWGDGYGGGGVLQESEISLARDLSKTINLEGEFGYWFQVSPRNPLKGEKIYIVGYDHASKFEQVLVELTVLEVFAGHITYDGSALGGSSGSCVLLEDSTVVAVNVAHVDVNGGKVGIGVLVTGEWNDLKH